MTKDWDDSGVHRTHCCVRHGCKYGDDDCPVYDGTLKQDYDCEDCNQPSGYGEYTNEQVEALIKRYEFIAKHAKYMEIHFDGMRDKVYIDTPTQFEDRIDQSMKMFLNPEED